MTEKPKRKLSFSSLSLFEACPRKWYFQYVRKLDPGLKKGTAFGSAFHTDLEKYLKTGDMPSERRHRQLLERAIGWDYLPEPGTVDLEFRFEVPFAHTTLIGSVDMIDTHTPNVLSISDHKTGRDPRWRKTEEQLAHDGQLGLYLKALTVLKGEPSKVYLGRHLWYRSEGPIEVHQVGPVEFKAEKLEDIWNQKHLTAKYIQVIDSCEDVSMVPGNKQACSSYGGCPYQDACRLSWDQNTPSLGGNTTMENSIMSLADRLNAANAKRTTNASTPAEPPAQTPAKPVLPTPEERAEALNVDRAQVQKLGQESGVYHVRTRIGNMYPIPNRKALDLLLSQGRVVWENDTVVSPTGAITWLADTNLRAIFNEPPASDQETETSVPAPASRAPAKPRVLLVSGAVVSGSSKVKYLDDLMAPAMAKIQATKGVPYFAIQYNEGAKLLAASFPDVADQINVGDIIVVRGDISWTQLVVEQIRQKFEVVDVVGVR